MVVVIILIVIFKPIITAIVEEIEKVANIPINFIPALALLVVLLICFVAQPFPDLDYSN